MAILTTFNIGSISPYVEDCFEDPLYLKSHPLEEGEANVE